MKSLKDYENIKEFIELLEQQGLSNEKKQLDFPKSPASTSLISYLMDMKYNKGILFPRNT